MRGTVPARRGLRAWTGVVLVLTLGSLLAGTEPARASSLKTEVIFLQEVDADRAIVLWDKVIGPAPEATIVKGREPNVVVVKDSPERLARFHALIAALDRKGAAARRIYIRPVAYLLPSELAKELDEIAGATGDELRMVPDDRTQRLVVITTAAIYRRVDLVARRLDVPGQGRDIRVLPAPDGSRPGDFPP